MPDTTFLARHLRLVNAVLFALAVGLAFDHSVAEALSRYTEPVHWSSQDSEIVVADHTGDPEWHAATQHAVAVWNDARPRFAPRLRWAASEGPCLRDGARVGVCQAPHDSLGMEGLLGRQGVASLDIGERGHSKGGVVLVCSDCRLDAARRRVVATHELGHVLGLGHSRRSSSVMYHTGGADVPDASDRAELGRLYSHQEGPDRCGFFNVHVGMFCL